MPNNPPPTWENDIPDELLDEVIDDFKQEHGADAELANQIRQSLIETIQKELKALGTTPYDPDILHAAVLTGITLFVSQILEALYQDNLSSRGQAIVRFYELLNRLSLIDMRSPESPNKHLREVFREKIMRERNG